MGDNKPAHDKETLAAIIVFVIICVCFVFWISLHVQISSGLRWLRVGELKLASLFTDRYDTIIKQLVRMAPEDIRPAQLLIMSDATSEVLQIPITAIFALMALVSYFKKEKHPYTRKLNLEGLTKEQASAFPVTAPIVKFNPLKDNFRAHGNPIPEHLPPFAEALTPDEWVAHNSVPVTDGKIDTTFARLAFAKQLGKRWKGVQELPLYAQALFAAFSMKAAGLRLETDDFMGELAKAWEPGKGLMLNAKLRKEIKAKIADPKYGRVTEKICALHSFVNPALARALQAARDNGGVLAPAQFLWLRAVDRHLWYALNNLGRSATHAEASGSLAHYRAEKSAGKPIPNPQVDTAIDGLVSFLLDNYITQFPAKEYARK